MSQAPLDRRARFLWGFLIVAMVAMAAVTARPPRTELAAAEAPAAKTLDPAAWGSDHVGEEIPEYMESGECLFCHRNEVGTTWGANKHNRTIREPEDNNAALAALRGHPATKQLADEVQLILGDTRENRFLKRSAAYGKLDVLSAGASLSRTGRAKLDQVDNPTWNPEIFAAECAGCHATAVDPETHAFAAPSLDCFACHGNAPAKHANDPKLMPLAKDRKDSAAAVTSICAQCHVRIRQIKVVRIALSEQLRGGRQSVPRLPVRLRVGRRSENQSCRSACTRQRARRSAVRSRVDDVPQLPQRSHRIDQGPPRRARSKVLPALPRGRQVEEGTYSLRDPQPAVPVLIVVVRA